MKPHTESNLWKDLKKAIPKAGLTRHETRLEDGLPDCSYSYKIHGWIELKQYQWPKNPDAILEFTKFKPQQKSFLYRKDNAVGHTFILAWIGREYLWFLGRDSYELGTLTRDELKRLSVHHTTRLCGDIYPLLTQKWPS